MMHGKLYVFQGKFPDGCAISEESWYRCATCQLVSGEWRLERMGRSCMERSDQQTGHSELLALTGQVPARAELHLDAFSGLVQQSPLEHREYRPAQRVHCVA